MFPLVVLDYSLQKDMNIHVQTSEISIQNFQINSYHVPREREILMGVNGPISYQIYFYRCRKNLMKIEDQKRLLLG